MNREILNIVNRVLSEEMSGIKNHNRKRIFEAEGMCSECGSPMNEAEGMCSECGVMSETSEFKESKHLSKGQKHIARQSKPYNKIDAGDFKKLRNRKKEMSETSDDGSLCEVCGSNNMNEDMCSECGNIREYSEFKESKNLSKGQKYIARQSKPYDKIDAGDFQKLRNKKRGSVKESILYSIVIDNKKMLFNEHEVIDIIENIVLEEKSKKKSKIPNVTKSSLNKSKKQNDDYVSSVVKKMKDYLKVGSKGEYDMMPKSFPKGNGELEKMNKMAYTMSDTAQEYVDNFTAAGLENLEYDEIHPNDEWVTMNLVGSSRTGNNPEWGNAVETGVGERRNKIRKNNLLAKVKRDAYQKDDQPIRYDSTGQDYGDTVDDLLKKYGSKKEKTKKTEGKKLRKESTENIKLKEDMNEIFKLMNYNRKTQ